MKAHEYTMNAREREMHMIKLELWKEDQDLPQDFDGEDCLLAIESRYGRQAYTKGTKGFMLRDWICEWLFDRRWR